MCQGTTPWARWWRHDNVEKTHKLKGKGQPFNEEKMNSWRWRKWTARKRRQRKKLFPSHPLQQGEGGSRGHVQDVQQFADRDGSHVARPRYQRDPPTSRNIKWLQACPATRRRSPPSQRRRWSMQQQERHPEGHRVGDAAELKNFTISWRPPTIPDQGEGRERRYQEENGLSSLQTHLQ